MVGLAWRGVAGTLTVLSAASVCLCECFWGDFCFWLGFESSDCVLVKSQQQHGTVQPNLPRFELWAQKPNSKLRRMRDAAEDD